MEKTLYIPTSSLNFNNIISTESISPASFYAQRSFGMKRFTNIFENQYNNIIIASEQLLSFSRPISEVEDHPMLLEVTIDEKEIGSNGNGYYAINKTIYITPYSSRFIFFSQQDRLVTESISEHSLDAKLSKLYIPRMTVVHPTGAYNFSVISIKEDNVSIDNRVMDERLNRLKGMIYGYYIGTMLSTNKVEIEKLRILQEVQNEFSAIISSGANSLFPEKERRLRELSIRWSHLSPLYVGLQNEGYDVEKLSSILTKYGVRLPIGNLGLSLYIKYLTQQYEEDLKNPALLWIEQEIEKQCMSMLKSGPKNNPDDGAIITNGTDLINIEVLDHDELVKHWFNTLLLDSKQTALDSYSKMELADMITDSAIAFMGNDWKESNERIFLNKLRKHIAGDALDIKWNNGALCSIAAVILRGEEWDTLLNFMQRKGMYDYRLAFAMYGALTGYANITRDFVDRLYDDMKYGQQVYKEIYGQLLGKDIQSEKMSQTYSNNIDEKSIEGTAIVEKQVNNAVDILNQIRSHKEFKSKYEPFCKEIEARGIRDWNEIIGLGKWKGFIEKVKKDIILNNRKRAEWSQGSLFGSNANTIQSYYTNSQSKDDSCYFYNDKEAWSKIEYLVPKEFRKELKSDLEWFQAELQKGKNSKYYSKVDGHSNKNAIAVFCKLKDGAKNKEDAKYFPSWLRDEIKQRLLTLYCNND